MKISTILTIASITFLSYWSYTKFYSEKQELKKELKIEIPEEENAEIIMENEEEKDPLSPLQKLVHDHFQIAHR